MYFMLSRATLAIHFNFNPRVNEFEVFRTLFRTILKILVVLEVRVVHIIFIY